MSNNPNLKSKSKQNTEEEIEKLIGTFRPTPSKKLYYWASQEGWKGRADTPRWSIGNIFQRRVMRLAVAFGLVVLLSGLSLFTSWGQSYAQSIFRFFQVAPSSFRTEIVSMTPIPSPDLNYPYNQYRLTVIQAQDQAGFKVLTPGELPGKFTYHGALYDPELKKIGLLYTIGPLSGETNGSPYGWVYVNEQLTDFEQDWGVCPTGEIRQVDINGKPAEIASGITWMTDQRPEPGAKREWVCVASGDSFAIRWQVNDLRMEISVAQFPGEDSLYFTQQNLIDFAMSFK